METEAILDELASTLTARFGRVIEVVRTEAGGRSIELRGFEAIEPHHTSLAQAREVRAGGVIRPGLLWIVNAIVEHGCVVPESPSPQLEKQLRR